MRSRAIAVVMLAALAFAPAAANTAELAPRAVGDTSAAARTSSNTPREAWRRSRGVASNGARVAQAWGRGGSWLPRDAGLATAQAGGRASHLVRLARRLARRERAFLGLEGFRLRFSEVRSSIPADERQLAVVAFDVVSQGLRLFDAEVVFVVANGNVVAFWAELPPARPGDRPATVLSSAAARRAIYPRAGTVGAATRVWRRGDLGWRWLDGSFEPAWRVIVRDRDAEVTQRVDVSAVDGRVLEVRSVVAHGQAVGGVHLRSPLEAETLMPLANLEIQSGDVAVVTDAAGRFPFEEGTVTASLSGPYAVARDECGPTAVSFDAADVDFGAAWQWDCATPFASAPGVNSAARTATYHVNRIRDLYRAHDATTPWLDQAVGIRSNRMSECENWFDGENLVLNWNGSSGVCANAAINADEVYHEWGHAYQWGQKSNFYDAATREGYADVTGMLQIRHHCLGEGFYLPPFTSGEGGSSCSGYREMDYRTLDPAVPARPDNVHLAPYACPPRDDLASRGIAGLQGHCESHIMTQAMWELGEALSVKYGRGTGWDRLLRMWIAAGPLQRNAWQLTAAGPPASGDGCNPGSWYQALLIANDDNGDLTDGVPDGATIHTAFANHDIACDDGGTPLDAPACPNLGGPDTTVSYSPGDDSAVVSWTPISGAVGYRVGRSELGPDGPFTPIGVVDADTTSFHDPHGTAMALHWYAVAALGGGSCESALGAAAPSTSCVPAVALAEPLEGGSLDATDGLLAWTLAANATSYEVFLGPNSDPPPLTTTADTTLEVPGTILAPGTTYVWRVEARGGGDACPPVSSQTRTLTVPGTAPAPLIDRLSEDHAPAQGGTRITIAGENLYLGARVLFGGTPGSDVVHLDSRQLAVTVPPHPPGAVDVVVENPDAQTATAAGAFAYEGTTIVAASTLGDMEVDEDGDGMPDGWSEVGNTDARGVCRPPRGRSRSGLCALLVRKTDATPAGTVKHALSVAGGRGGDIVRVTLWVRPVNVSDGTKLRAIARFRRQGALVQAADSHVDLVGAGYREHTVWHVATQEYDEVVLRFRLTGSSGRVFIDDAELRVTR